MKKSSLLILIFTSCILGSCASIVPLTNDIVEAVGGEDQLGNFQYYVSRTIYLDKVNDATNADLVEGKAKVVRTIERDHITIKKSTPGVVLNHKRTTAFDSYKLSVAFEADDDHFLQFQRKSTSDKLYYILTRNDWVYYGGSAYKYTSPVQREWLGFGKEKKEVQPHLLIKLNRKLIEKQNKRTAKGRKL